MGMIATERLFLTADKAKLVPEGHKDGAFLYAAPGDEIPDSAVEKFGLVKGGMSAAAKKKLADEAAAQAKAEEKAAEEAAAKAEADRKAAEEKATAEKAAADEAAAKEAAAAQDKEAKAGADKSADGKTKGA